jgi:molybdopterin converting factor small subunit
LSPGPAPGLFSSPQRVVLFFLLSPHAADAPYASLRIPDGNTELSLARARLYHAYMSVTVLLFATYADALGAQSVSLDLPPEATVADVLAEIGRRPGGEQLPPSPLVAVNQRYAAVTAPVRSGDEVALIPPVAGG